MTPEQEAREEIDDQLQQTGWAVQSADEMDITAARGVAQAKGNLEDFFEQGRGAPAAPPAAAAWYRSGAEAGIASAQYKLGIFYAKGQGVARDDLEAVKWLSAAAEQGDAKALRELADVYFVLAQRTEKGEGVAQNQQIAQQHYAEAAALGNKRALDRLVEIREKAGDRDGAGFGRLGSGRREDSSRKPPAVAELLRFRRPEIT